LIKPGLLYGLRLKPESKVLKQKGKKSTPNLCLQRTTHVKRLQLESAKHYTKPQSKLRATVIRYFFSSFVASILAPKNRQIYSR
jgi:hypothetical protein